MTNGNALLKTKDAKAPRRVTILGSTGSVGTQTIDLIERDLAAYQVVALSANKNVALLAEQAKKLKPEMAVIADESKYQELKDALAGEDITVAAGAKAIVDAAETPSDWLMAGIMGAAGLPSTIAAARRGGKIAFANKETLVCAGPLMMRIVASCGATLLPVDSEHNAIFQVFDPARRDAVVRLIITASGGPFYKRTQAEMEGVTAAEAIKHPVWSMGAKISIDSATMMNKALEVIEAAHLFQMPSEKIDVLVHPQSVIHSMVEYADGSVLGQFGTPDMRIPIGHTLAWPDRMATPAPRLDFVKLGQLTFEAPDSARFPALALGRDAMALGETAPAIMSAANEIAVDAFLKNRIGFLDIERVARATLAHEAVQSLTDLAVLAEVDASARRFAAAEIDRLAAKRA